MPESKLRPAAAAKKKVKRAEEIHERRVERSKSLVASPAARRWVAPTFITVGLVGVAWLVVYYIGGEKIPAMAHLGNWNILIGMGLMAMSFVIASFWK